MTRLLHGAKPHQQDRRPGVPAFSTPIHCQFLQLPGLIPVSACKAKGNYANRCYNTIVLYHHTHITVNWRAGAAVVARRNCPTRRNYYWHTVYDHYSPAKLSSEKEKLGIWYMQGLRPGNHSNQPSALCCCMAPGGVLRTSRNSHDLVRPANRGSVCRCMPHTDR